MGRKAPKAPRSEVKRRPQAWIESPDGADAVFSRSWLLYAHLRTICAGLP